VQSVVQNTQFQTNHFTYANSTTQIERSNSKPKANSLLHCA